MAFKIALIGSGIAALALAHKLKDKADITLFEKARGVGGRLATRYADPYRFDHGAQFFYVKTKAFEHFIEPMIKAGVVRRWEGRFAEFEGNEIVSRRIWDDTNPHYVGVPGMNGVAHFLAEGLDVRLNTRVVRLERTDDWQLFDEQGQDIGHFDWVISTAPAEQTAKLLPPQFAHHAQIEAVKMKACFSLMLGFGKPLDLGFDVALVRDADISWISVNSSKPGRADEFTLLVHSTNDWAEAHIDDDRDEVLRYVLAQTEKVTGTKLQDAAHKVVHGWRFANVDKQPQMPPLIDAEMQLGACGDWCIQGRVESAFTSALALTDALSAHLEAR